MASLEPNARDFRRYAVSTDRAQGIVSFDGMEHDAVIADTSATGFGLLLMRGVHLEVGQTLCLMADESIHECEVAYIHPEESFQHVGVKRLSDTPMVELKVFHLGRPLYKPKAGGMSFLLFIGVIVGFTAMFISVATVMGFKRAGQGDNASEVFAGGIRNESASQPAVNLRDRIEQKKRQSQFADRQSGGGSLTNLLRKQQVAVRRLLNKSGMSWETLVETLGLSSSQERRLLETLNNGSAISAKEAALNILSLEQRMKLSLL